MEAANVITQFKTIQIKDVFDLPTFSVNLKSLDYELKDNEEIALFINHDIPDKSKCIRFKVVVEKKIYEVLVNHGFKIFQMCNKPFNLSNLDYQSQTKKSGVIPAHLSEIVDLHRFLTLIFDQAAKSINLTSNEIFEKLKTIAPLKYGSYILKLFLDDLSLNVPTILNTTKAIRRVEKTAQLNNERKKNAIKKKFSFDIDESTVLITDSKIRTPFIEFLPLMKWSECKMKTLGDLFEQILEKAMEIFGLVALDICLSSIVDNDGESVYAYRLITAEETKTIPTLVISCPITNNIIDNPSMYLTNSPNSTGCIMLRYADIHNNDFHSVAFDPLGFDSLRCEYLDDLIRRHEKVNQFDVIHIGLDNEKSVDFQVSFKTVTSERLFIDDFFAVLFFGEQYYYNTNRFSTKLKNSQRITNFSEKERLEILTNMEFRDRNLCVDNYLFSASEDQFNNQVFSDDANKMNKNCKHCFDVASKLYFKFRKGDGSVINFKNYPFSTDQHLIEMERTGRQININDMTFKTIRSFYLCNERFSFHDYFAEKDNYSGTVFCDNATSIFNLDLMDVDYVYLVDNIQPFSQHLNNLDLSRFKVFRNFEVMDMVNKIGLGTYLVKKQSLMLTFSQIGTLKKNFSIKVNSQLTASTAGRFVKVKTYQDLNKNNIKLSHHDTKMFGFDKDGQTKVEVFSKMDAYGLLNNFKSIFLEKRVKSKCYRREFKDDTILCRDYIELRQYSKDNEETLFSNKEFIQKIADIYATHYCAHTHRMVWEYVQNYSFCPSCHAVYKFGLSSSMCQDSHQPVKKYNLKKEQS